MVEKKQIWFKAKRYGWGWGMPANRRGWTAFAVFLAVWLLSLLWLVSTGEPTEQLETKNIAIFSVILFADILALIIVSFKYGEAPKWRWGGKTRAERKKDGKSKSD